MQKRLAIGQGVKILDQKNRGGFNEPLPASLRVNLEISTTVLKADSAVNDNYITNLGRIKVRPSKQQC